MLQKIKKKSPQLLTGYFVYHKASHDTLWHFPVNRYFPMAPRRFGDFTSL